jgi:hypothetical protein
MLKLFKKLFIKEYQFDETETLIKDVVKNLLKQKDTEAMTAPISMTYYIRNDRMEYFIKTDGESIMITNHKFTFKEKMGIKFSEIITDIIKDFMETNRKEFENSVFKNQLELLKNIKESLENQN